MLPDEVHRQRCTEQACVHTMPLGPRVVLTMSAIAIAPTKEDCKCTHFCKRPMYVWTCGGACTRAAPHNHALAPDMHSSSCAIPFMTGNGQASARAKMSGHMCVANHAAVHSSTRPRQPKLQCIVQFEQCLRVHLQALKQSAPCERSRLSLLLLLRPERC
jgi:hypothetical protein